MSISSPDSEKYLKAITDLAHLIKVFGSADILMDLHHFFPDEYEDMLKALDRGIKTKQLARLLDATKGGCSRTRVANISVVIAGPDGAEGDK